MITTCLRVTAALVGRVQLPLPAITTSDDHHVREACSHAFSFSCHSLCGCALSCYHYLCTTFGMTSPTDRQSEHHLYRATCSVGC